MAEEQAKSDEYDLTLPEFYSIKADNGEPVVTVEGTIKYVTDATAAATPAPDRMEGLTGEGRGNLEDEMSHMINALTFVQLSEPVTNLTVAPFTVHTYKDPHVSTRTLTYLMGDMTYIAKLIPESVLTPMKSAVQKVYKTLSGLKDFQQRIDSHLTGMWFSMPMHDKHMLNSPLLVHLFGNMMHPYPIYNSPYAMAHELLALIVLCESSVNDAAVPKSYLPDDKERASKYVKDVGRAYQAQLSQLNIWFYDAMKGLTKTFPTLLQTMWKLPGSEAQLQTLLKAANDDEEQKKELIQKFWLAVEAQTADIPISTTLNSDPNMITMGALTKQILPQFEIILNRATLAAINLMEAKALNLLGWTCNYPIALAAQRQYSMVWPTINSVGSSEYLAQVPKVWRCFFTKHAINTPMVLQRKFWAQQLENTVSFSVEKKKHLLEYIATDDMDNLWTYAALANAVNTTNSHMGLLRDLYYSRQTQTAGGEKKGNVLQGTTWTDELLTSKGKETIKNALETINMDVINQCWQRAMLSELQVFTHKLMR